MKALAPARLAAKHEKLQIRLSCSELPRFLGSVSKSEGHVRAELEFSPSDYSICQVVGRLRAAVWLDCQRCLEPARLDIEATLDMHIVASDAAAKILPAGLDPFILSGPEVGIAELIEDALIMALPMVPKHDDCQLAYDNPNEPQRRENPFAVLKDVK